MPKKRYETAIDAPVELLWEFHSSAEALHLLSPPGTTVTLLSDAEVREGARHVVRVHQFGFALTWVADISEVSPPFGFNDTAAKSPFRYWRHRHAFNPLGSGSTLVDEIEYCLPFGFLGKLAEPIASRAIDRLFAHRHRITKALLEEKAKLRALPS
jgi:ligand-binding SRPBCC domain-containing protein